MAQGWIPRDPAGSAACSGRRGEPDGVPARLDPFERMTWPENGTLDGAQNYFSWFQYEFWRYVFVQQEVAKLAQSAIEYPPMQKGSSFNLDAVKAQIEEAVKKQAGQ